MLKEMWGVKYRNEYLVMIGFLLVTALFCGHRDPLASVNAEKAAKQTAIHAQQLAELAAMKPTTTRLKNGEGWFELYQRIGIPLGKYPNEVIKKDFNRRNPGHPRMWADDEVSVPKVPPAKVAKK